MLLGRQHARERIGRLLAAARRGRSGALVIRGEPGIGKSAVLNAAREQAGRMTVLAATGLESESELPFAGLSELLAPVLGRLDSIPAPQRVALEGGLAMGPAGPRDRFAAYAGLLSLLAAAAEEAPILVLIDDAQWLDRPSAEALVFAGRRLGDEFVAILIAARDGERRAFAAPGLEQMRLAGLDLQSALTLLTRGAQHDVSTSVGERVNSAAAGNPLALLELRDVLTPAQLSGREPLPDPLPLGGALKDAYRRRIGWLPAATRRALVAAAASDTGATEEVQAALKVLRIDPSALEPAEMADIVVIAPERIEFRHPLLRSAAYHSATASERRGAHRALAAALRDENAVGKRAWHRATAATAPDEEVASDLEQAACEARGRGAPASAASAMEAAAGLTPGPDRRARRLLGAGRDAYLAGQISDASRLLDEASERADDCLLEAEIRHLRGQVEMFAGSPSAAREQVLSAARTLEPLDRGRAVLALADAAGTFTMEARQTRALHAAERAHALGQQVGGLPAQVSAVALGGAAALCGQSERVPDLFEEAKPLLAADALAAHPWGCLLALSRTFVDEDLEAQQLITTTVEALRAASAIGFLPYALAAQCTIELRLGNWASAYAAGSESARLAEETGQRNEHSWSSAVLARLEAGTGRRAQCVSHASTALAAVREMGTGSVGAQARAALGLLELGCDRPLAAAEQLELSARFVEGLGQPTVVRSMADHVEAYARAGEAAGAERVLAVLAEQADRSGGRWANAAAARCRGLLAGETDFEQHFRTAISRHRQTIAPFETARTRLCFGERLRRARRTADAREQLHLALDTFERLGAAPWATKARRELDASGERRAGPPAADITELLTPQELQVALRVSEGDSTKDAAAALFVSPRTVDAHLNRIYRKLGIRSRSQLTRIVLERLASAEVGEAGG